MPRKQGRQGSVYFDKNRKKWRGQIYEMDYSTGKYNKKTRSFDTEDEAKEYVECIMYQTNNPLYIKNNGIPLNQLMRANAKKKLDTNSISENQYGRILRTIEVIENSSIARKMIDELTSDEIQGYLNSIKYYSNSYIKKIYEQFTQSYTYAMNKGYIRKNPLDEIIKPKSDKKNKIVRALTVDEQQDFNKHLINLSTDTQPYKNAFLIQMYMGTRIGETLALRNSDIDLKHNIIKIDKTLTTDKDGKVIMGDSAKTYAGNRELPIPHYLRDFIIEQMQIAQNNRDKQLFMSENGNYVDSRNVNRVLKKILDKELNITDISTHSLRHTYGTRCIEAGMNPVVLQKLMGHNDVSVTLNTYMSVFNKYKESELEKVNNYYINNALLPDKNIELPNIEIDPELELYISKIQEKLKELNQYITNKQLMLSTDLYKNSACNKSIVLSEKSTNNEDLNFEDNKNYFKDWNEINAFIDGIFFARSIEFISKELDYERVER